MGAGREGVHACVPQGCMQAVLRERKPRVVVSSVFVRVVLGLADSTESSCQVSGFTMACPCSPSSESASCPSSSCEFPSRDVFSERDVFLSLRDDASILPGLFPFPF